MIDGKGKPSEVPNLRAVPSVVAGLIVSDKRLIRRLFKETAAMMESPIMVDILSERMHRAIVRALKAKFGAVPQEVQAELEKVTDDEQLDRLVEFAAVSPTLDNFREQLESAK